MSTMVSDCGHQHHHECHHQSATFDRSHCHFIHSNEHDHPSDSLRHKESNDIDEDRHQKHVLRKLKIAAIFCFLFLVVEVVGGIVAGSLVVLSDAAHRAADISAYLVAIVGSRIASLPPTAEYTFGLKRTESVVALFSMVTLAVMSIGLAVEAIRRIWGFVLVPDEMDVVDGKLMTMIALIGVVVNVILAIVLGEDHVHMPGADSCSHHSEHNHSHGGNCNNGEGENILSG